MRLLIIMVNGALGLSSSCWCRGSFIVTSHQKNWREWAGAGAVQAFIIALYAEMYGFPLTIYLLVRFFDLDSEYVSANLWSSLVGLGEIGMLVSMLLGYAIAFIGVGLRLLRRIALTTEILNNGS